MILSWVKHQNMLIMFAKNDEHCFILLGENTLIVFAKTFIFVSYYVVVGSNEWLRPVLAVSGRNLRIC